MKLQGESGYSKYNVGLELADRQPSVHAQSYLCCSIEGKEGIEREGREGMIGLTLGFRICFRHCFYSMVEPPSVLICLALGSQCLAIAQTVRTADRCVHRIVISD